MLLLILIKKLAFLGRDIMNESKATINKCLETELSKNVPTVKGADASPQLKPNAESIKCATFGTLLLKGQQDKGRIFVAVKT